MEIQQNTPKPNDYKELLARSSSFPHLLFYNRKLISPYYIASHGFRWHKFREGQGEAICESCSASFKFDPILENQTIKSKESLRHVLMNHESTCQFAGNERVNIDRRTFCVEGPKIYEEIFKQNMSNEAHLSSLEQFPPVHELFSDYLSQQLIQQFTRITGKKSRKINLLSLFGWALKENENSLHCLYCGKTGSKTKFHLVHSHRSWCILIKDNYWKTLCEQIIVNALSTKEGEFMKTEGHMRAKQIRDELTTAIVKPLEVLDNFKNRINEMKDGLEETAEEDEVLVLSNLGRFAEEVQQFIKNGVKKVKVE